MHLGVHMPQSKGMVALLTEHLGVVTAAAAAAGSTVASKEEERLRDVIEGELLDRRPSVRWKDIAGLAGAKQVCTAPR